MTCEQVLKLVAGGQDGTLVLWTKQNKAHHHFSTIDEGAAASFARHQATLGLDIYVRSNVQEGLGNKVDTVSSMTIVSLDFDLAGPGHKTANLPTSAEQLEPLLVSAGIPEPTVIISTGGGVQALWALEDPIKITSAKDLARAKELSRGFQRRIVQAAAQAGFHVDATHDLVRCVRLPETRNWKPAYGDDGAEVTVRCWSGRLLTSGELERVAGLRKPANPVAMGTQAKSRLDEETSTREPEWEAIYNGCDAVRAWANVLDGLPEPMWYAMASIIGRCRSGRTIFHDLSKQDVRYDAGETDNKLDQALAASKPRTCDNIESLGGACGACPFRGRINSPITLGYASDPFVPALARRWVYIASRNAFVDLHKLEASQ